LAMAENTSAKPPQKQTPRASQLEPYFHTNQPENPHNLAQTENPQYSRISLSSSLSLSLSLPFIEEEKGKSTKWGKTEKDGTAFGSLDSGGGFMNAGGGVLLEAWGGSHPWLAWVSLLSFISLLNPSIWCICL
jgi:hypothetical protein